MGATAQDIMSTDLMTVTPATSLSQFARICIEDNISGCPVVTIDGRLEGIVSKTDLLERLLEGRHNYSANPDFRRLMGLGEEGVFATGGAASESEDEIFGRVEDIMAPDPVTVLPDAAVFEVTRLMAEHRIHRVLVEEHGKLLGIITSLDLIAHLASGGGLT
ncbi:MAG: CBS domain-containing protein [Planctomycetota bacterium]|jgi:CBS domain-containing protein